MTDKTMRPLPFLLVAAVACGEDPPVVCPGEVHARFGCDVWSCYDQDGQGYLLAYGPRRTVLLPCPDTCTEIFPAATAACSE